MEENTKTEDLSKTYIITESNEDSYKVEGSLQYELKFEGDEYSVEGILETDYFINDTELINIKSIFGTLNNVNVTNIIVDVPNTKIIHKFTAESFDIAE